MPGELTHFPCSIENEIEQFVQAFKQSGINLDKTLNTNGLSFDNNENSTVFVGSKANSPLALTLSSSSSTSSTTSSVDQSMECISPLYGYYSTHGVSSHGMYPSSSSLHSSESLSSSVDDDDSDEQCIIPLLAKQGFINGNRLIVFVYLRS